MCQVLLGMEQGPVASLLLLGSSIMTHGLLQNTIGEGRLLLAIASLLCSLSRLRKSSILSRWYVTLGSEPDVSY